jgi:lipoate-protein ligase A
VHHLFDSFRTRFGGTLGELTADELAAAERLVAAKYGNEEWTGQFE